MKSSKQKSENEPADLVQGLVSRLEKLESKVAELGGLIEQLTQKAPVAASPAGVKTPEIAPHLLAVIAAAIDTVVKAPYLVRSIREIQSGKSTYNPLNWSIEGRREIFTSHHVR